ncbi:MAG TPA: hypothetical protein VHZ24_03485 [Pirellulales bacterium]|jgi:hypothetical protein|nr:hypothetical protein [Pirellulales bacterium]
MSSGQANVREWEDRRTDESRAVEAALRQHFRNVDAYRYNSASLRLRIVDPAFKGLSHDERDARVEPFLSKLDERTQADIMNLVLLYPGEEAESFRAHLFNEEFEHPSRSML